MLARVVTDIQIHTHTHTHTHTQSKYRNPCCAWVPRVNNKNWRAVHVNVLVPDMRSNAPTDFMIIERTCYYSEHIMLHMYIQNPTMHSTVTLLNQDTHRYITTSMLIAASLHCIHVHSAGSTHIHICSNTNLYAITLNFVLCYHCLIIGDLVNYL